jgi:hypothetical protein
MMIIVITMKVAIYVDKNGTGERSKKSKGVPLHAMEVHGGEEV